MRSRVSARISRRVCGCTPSTAETTSTAPSRTLRTRSTSAMKSGWPGVSIRLTVTSSMTNDTTADLIVMPRCRSSARESVCVLPSSTLPTSSMTPAAYSSRSVSVVLPASTCAKIPKLSVRRSKRHTLRIGREALLDGHERSAHFRSLGRPALVAGTKAEDRAERGDAPYARAVTELTAELIVDRLDPREVAVSDDGRLIAFVAAPVGRPTGTPAKRGVARAARTLRTPPAGSPAARPTTRSRGSRPTGRCSTSSPTARSGRSRSSTVCASTAAKPSD